MKIKARTVFGFLLTIIDFYCDSYNNLRAICVNSKGDILEYWAKELTIIDEEYLPKGASYDGT